MVWTQILRDSLAISGYKWIEHCLGLCICLHIVLAITVDEFSDQIKVYPNEQKVTEHAIATFICDTPMVPVPPIYWRRNGRRLTNQGSYQIFRTWTGSVLRVEPVRAKRDDALFECVIDDGINEPLAQAVMLRVYPKGHKPRGYPQVLEDPTLRVVEEEQSCILACTVLGDPKPKVMWLKDYVPIDMEVFRYNILEHGSLQIGYASDTDEGTYECVAENELGVAYSSPARLVVDEYSWP